MLILLPPSETKRAGGTGPALDLGALSFPELTDLRRQLLDGLLRLATDLPAARRALQVSVSKDDEIGWNAELASSATLPALDRYTGVLYDHLAVGGFTRLQRARAEQRIVIGSALFGATRATDLIPAYRVSAGSRLPNRPGLAALWRPLLAPALVTTAELTLDLRSGAYAALGPVPDAITVNVVTEDTRGHRSVISHFGKATKGDLARVLCLTRAELDSVTAVVRAARKAGLTIERSGPRSLTLLA